MKSKIRKLLCIYAVMAFCQIFSCEPPKPNEDGIISTEDYWKWRHCENEID